jgi:predicted HAD superfamily Cof-like phosphohydrolase
MKDAFDKVTEFHRAFGVTDPAAPTLADAATQQLRFKLISEEFAEYQEALAKGDLVEVADALADLAYVVVGSAVAHGLTRFGDMFAEVHRSNMSKLGADGKPVRREDGKVLKGPSWSPPDLRPFIWPSVGAGE